jgi:Cu-Zn family superoxide dismutase
MGDCMTTGEHFNPSGADHGGRESEERHAGDLGNLNADALGNSGDIMESQTIRLFGDETVVGRSIVIHAGEDDLGEGGDPESAANGNSGERIACCTISLINSS